jgi:lipid II:glycine glycyltransferase (peptidoglycan interpeptide bridge formation enzyme)
MKLITDINSIDKQSWRDFVADHPHGNIFQTPEMYDAYRNTRNYEPIFLAITDDNKIEAILLAVIQKENYSVIDFLTARSIIFGGPIFDENRPYLLDALLKEYAKLIKHKAVYTQIRNFWEQNEKLKETFGNHGYDNESHLNILVDLTVGTDKLWKDVKRNRKDGINKAKKQNFKFKVIDYLPDIDNFYALLVELFINIRLPYPDISLFKNLNTLSKNVRWFILDYEGKPRIILCGFLFNGTLYAFFIGISQDRDFQKLRPVDLFYWEVIRWGAENGMKFFDWMGAGRPEKHYGVRNFKLQYGGTVHDFGRYEKIHNSFHYHLAKIGLEIWQKLK